MLLIDVAQIVILSSDKRWRKDGHERKLDLLCDISLVFNIRCQTANVPVRIRLVRLSKSFTRVHALISSERQGR